MQTHNRPEGLLRPLAATRDGRTIPSEKRIGCPGPQLPGRPQFLPIPWLLASAWEHRWESPASTMCPANVRMIHILGHALHAFATWLCAWCHRRAERTETAVQMPPSTTGSEFPRSSYGSTGSRVVTFFHWQLSAHEPPSPTVFILVGVCLGWVRTTSNTASKATGTYVHGHAILSSLQESCTKFTRPQQGPAPALLQLVHYSHDCKHRLQKKKKKRIATGDFSFYFVKPPMVPHKV